LNNALLDGVSATQEHEFENPALLMSWCVLAEQLACERPFDVAAVMDN
jgi:hypothetical protein